jgi:hypothetical protein
MPARETEASGPPARHEPDQAADVRRIRFVGEPAAGDTVRRRFTAPRPAAAIEEPAQLQDFPPQGPWPEPNDHLYVVVIPRPRAGATPGREFVNGLLAPPSHPDALPAVTVELDGDAVHWRPGRAVVEAGPERSDKLIAGLTEFAFFEGELRGLEQDLLPYEAAAPADVALSYRIRSRHRAEWERLRQTMERLAAMRLTYARLERHLTAGSRSLSPEARRLVSRLLARSDAAARLGALGDRLEACEDLYEGAVDRVTDFRWYVRGFLLEVAIVILLAVETVLIAYDLFLA